MIESTAPTQSSKNSGKEWLPRQRYINNVNGRIVILNYNDETESYDEFPLTENKN